MGVQSRNLEGGFIFASDHNHYGWIKELSACRLTCMHPLRSSCDLLMPLQTCMCLSVGTVGYPHAGTASAVSPSSLSHLIGRRAT